MFLLGASALVGAVWATVGDDPLSEVIDGNPALDVPPDEHCHRHV